jgi:hypothetical protein
MFGKKTSDAQIAANRENARKSSGPVTPEGKEKVCRNAVKHGLTGSFELIEGENEELFKALLAQFMEDEKPVGIGEIELVKRMAEHTWMSERANRLQAACFIIVNQTPEQKEKGQAEVLVRPELERYTRYQAHHQRCYRQASKELRERRKERLKAEIGFVSQQHAEAEERRREKREIQRDELHSYKVATAKKRFEREELKTAAAAANLAKHFDGFEPSKMSKIAA